MDDFKITFSRKVELEGNICEEIYNSTKIILKQRFHLISQFFQQQNFEELAHEFRSLGEIFEHGQFFIDDEFKNTEILEKAFFLLINNSDLRYISDVLFFILSVSIHDVNILLDEDMCKVVYKFIFNEDIEVSCKSICILSNIIVDNEDSHRLVVSMINFNDITDIILRVEQPLGKKLVLSKLFASIARYKMSSSLSNIFLLCLINLLKMIKKEKSCLLNLFISISYMNHNYDNSKSVLVENRFFEIIELDNILHDERMIIIYLDIYYFTLVNYDITFKHEEFLKLIKILKTPLAHSRCLEILTYIIQTEDRFKATALNGNIIDYCRLHLNPDVSIQTTMYAIECFSEIISNVSYDDIYKFVNESEIQLICQFLCESDVEYTTTACISIIIQVIEAEKQLNSYRLTELIKQSNILDMFECMVIEEKYRDFTMSYFNEMLAVP